MGSPVGKPGTGALAGEYPRPMANSSQRTTTWVPDPTIEAGDGHTWTRPVDDCPNCPCHTLRVCEGGRWAEAGPVTYANGDPYTEPCPCKTAARRSYPAGAHGPGGPAL